MGEMLLIAVKLTEKDPADGVADFLTGSKREDGRPKKMVVATGFEPVTSSV